jgi:cytochrome d ubiquinol oxidase subunit II
METFWFGAVAAMFAAWIVLDGFDLGAGAVHLFVARTDRERREVFAAIGPVWDGNEVWLVAGGGTLFFAFPQAYAAGFSGFYLPLMLVLWLLAGRALSIELRSHLEHPLWRALWDALFSLSSGLLLIVLGAALGNVLRGVPLGADGWFHVPFFTDWRTGPHPGVLDWYTVLLGLFALAALSLHGALWLVLKTGGAVEARAAGLARPAFLAALALGVLSALATHFVQPGLHLALPERPWAWPLLAVALGGFIALCSALLRTGALLATPELQRRAFLGSAAFLSGTLGATAAGAFPVLLRSSLGAAFDLTASGAASSAHGLRLGFYWWAAAFPLAVAWVVVVYRATRGKVEVL